MEISSDRVVTIHYTLKDDSGTVLDSSAGGEPLAYIQGHGNLVPGLEKALEGKSAGDAVQVTVAPEQGYGARDQALIQLWMLGLEFAFADLRDTIEEEISPLFNAWEEPL